MRHMGVTVLQVYTLAFEDMTDLRKEKVVDDTMAQRRKWQEGQSLRSNASSYQSEIEMGWEEKDWLP